MATKTRAENAPEETKTLLDTLRRVLLAGIGAVALAQEEVEELVNRLIDRGEIAEKDGRKLVREIMDKRKKRTAKAEDEITRRIEGVLDRMNVPSKSDIEALGNKIADLTKKVEELKKS